MHLGKFRSRKAAYSTFRQVLRQEDCTHSGRLSGKKEAYIPADSAAGRLHELSTL